MVKESLKLKKIRAAHRLLYQDEINFRTFEQIRRILQGTNSKIDQALEKCAKSLRQLKRIQNRNVINLSLKKIPAKSEKDKKRKKALLLFLKYFKKLKKEVKRLEKQIESGGEKNSFRKQASSTSKFISKAKGPFGLVTIVAVLIVGGVAIINKTTKSLSQPPQADSTNQENGFTQLIDSSILSFWIEEVTAEPQGNNIVWGVHLHKQDDQTRAKEEHVPALGAQVTVRLESDPDSKELTGVVVGDGWVRWTEPKPTAKTTIKVLNVVGDIPWAEKDRVKWQGNDAVTFSP